MRGLLSVSGVIGTWAGPRSSGTAYVMLHHHIGDTDGQAGAWGFPRGGMGGVTAALAAAARSFGAELRTGAEVARIRTRAGRVTGVTLASGEEIDAATVITTAHPQISFLRLLDPAVLPAEFVEDIRGWQTRSGTVKINLALGRLPVFASHPEFDPQVHGGHDRAGREPRRHRERVPGRGRRAARRRCRSPTSASRACSTTRSPRRAST